VTGGRRFSQAISEGDGISIVVPVTDPEAARAAEEQGAEAIAIHGAVHSVREATSLPLLWRPHGLPRDAHAADADALVLVYAELEGSDGQLEQAYREALDLELEGALERLDPEIFLLVGDGEDEEPLEQALELLQDVPAGKLAIAELPISSRDEVAELERAGMDAVIVPGGNVAELVGGNAPDV
jgi:hypothetical protein